MGEIAVELAGRVVGESLDPSAHERLIDEYAAAGANLFSCDLTDAVATDAVLSKAHMDGTVLRRADFQRANLEGASLFATILEQTNLAGANLAGTRIIGYLRSANLAGASPETMASAVAAPLEKQFTTIAGLDAMLAATEPMQRQRRRLR